MNDRNAPHTPILCTWLKRCLAICILLGASALPALADADYAVGARVEGLSSKGWQAATIVSLAGTQATVRYDDPALGEEQIDVRLLRDPGGSQPTPPPRPPAPPPPPPRPLPPPLGGSAKGYIGCYKDTSDFDLNGHLDRSQNNTPQRCIATCTVLGYAYAGLQYGESCLCGNTYGKYGKADNCDYVCTGDSGQTCGGYSTNAIYATGVKH